MKRPIIGISCMQIRDTYGADNMGVGLSYLRAIAAAGGTPLMIQLSDDQDELRALYDLCDGILLSGGEDIAPACYGEEPRPELGGVDPGRDAAELTLARWAVADSKPLLGICRGIQLINVALGGTLYQDIPSQMDTQLCHTLSFDRNDWDAMAHPITLAAGSQLAALMGVDAMEVNSLHHQALKDVAPGLRAVAWAPDGLVEAVEGQGESFLIGVQCHPEELQATADPRWQALFRAFVERAASYRPGPVLAA